MRNTPKTIELSSIYFYEGTALRTIPLRECGLKMKAPAPGVFAGLYGYQSKTEGFMAARAYADKHRMQFTVVDYLVRLEHPINTRQMKPEEINEHDFASFSRMSRALADEIGELLWRKVTRGTYDPERGDDVLEFLAQHPEAITYLTDDPRWRHLKVIAYHTKLEMSEKPLAVGIVPAAHWHSISEATCRLDPTIRITLDPPSTDHPAPPVTTERPHPRMR